MAVIGTSAVLGRIVKALGLSSCRGFTLSASVNDVAMIRAEQHATGEQLDGVARALETNDYVIVPREEWEKTAVPCQQHDELRGVVRALLDHVNDKYPDKHPREWTCPHMARLDQLVPPEENARCSA